MVGSWKRLWSRWWKTEAWPRTDRILIKKISPRVNLGLIFCFKEVYVRSIGASDLSCVCDSSLGCNHNGFCTWPLGLGRNCNVSCRNRISWIGSWGGRTSTLCWNHCHNDCSYLSWSRWKTQGYCKNCNHGCSDNSGPELGRRIAKRQWQLKKRNWECGLLCW